MTSKNDGRNTRRHYGDVGYLCLVNYPIVVFLFYSFVRRMASSDHAVWTIYLAPAFLIVLFNAHWLWTIRAARKHRHPVASCRPLGISLLVADLLRGTSGLCQALFALLTSTSDGAPEEPRMCRVLGLTQQ